VTERRRNLLIANGYELIGQLSWSKGGGKKWLPYTIEDVRSVLHEQLEHVAQFARQTPLNLAPRGEVTAKVILHPAFLAKSYFPSAILRDSGLTILGSRPVSIVPKKVRNEVPKSEETASIFVSGTKDNFKAMDANLLLE
jgi:hypothetical protein